MVIMRSRVRSPPDRQHSFININHEIFSTVNRSLPLILVGQLSVSGERTYTSTFTGQPLKDSACPGKVRLG